MRYGKGAVEVRVSYAALSFNVFDGKLQTESFHPEGGRPKIRKRTSGKADAAVQSPRPYGPFDGTRAGTTS